MSKNTEIERNWLDFKRKCDFYYSRVLGYPLCPPEHVYFSLTNRCNLRCRMCGIPTSPSRVEDELTTEECKKIVDQIADLKIGHLVFSGGEPLLRDDIFDLISYAVSKRIKMVDIITNGILIDDEFAKKIVNIGLSHITVSIDGLEEKNDFIRGKGSFLKTIRSIDTINKYRNRKLLTIGINFTITDCNIDDMIPMIELARSKGCNIIVLQPMLSDNTDMRERKKNELWVSEDNLPRLEKIINEVMDLKKNMHDFSIHVNERILQMIPAYFSGAPLDKNLKCYEGIVRIVISYSGDLWTCQGIYGGLRKSRLKNLWFSGEIDKIRQKVKQCRSHCLQSCIQLPELSDVYSEYEKFKNFANTTGTNKELLKNSVRLFKKYKFLLRKKSVLENIAILLKKKKKENSIKDIVQEISIISDITRNYNDYLSHKC